MQSECIFSWGFAETPSGKAACRGTPSVCSLRSQPPSPRGRLQWWRETLRQRRKASPWGSCRAATEGVQKAPPSGDLSSVCETERVRPPTNKTELLHIVLAGNCAAMPRAPSQRGLSRRSRDWGSSYPPINKTTGASTDAPVVLL